MRQAPPTGGVRGLKGTVGDLADHRRVVLVRHAVNAGLVGPDDLGLMRAARPDTDLDPTG